MHRLTDPSGPVLIPIEQPAGARLMIGHTCESERLDDSALIPTLLRRQGSVITDGRCRRCRSRTELARDDRGGDVLILVVHRDGCRELAGLKRLAVRP